MIDHVVTWSLATIDVPELEPGRTIVYDTGGTMPTTKTMKQRIDKAEKDAAYLKAKGTEFLRRAAESQAKADDLRMQAAEAAQESEA